ncbi:MAG TPA: aldo/keto reductase [Polyangiaceae bacterium]|nr:aldo/keto reductase [Polyangiaceae bacterium]
MGGGSLHASWRRFSVPRDRAALTLLDAAYEAGCTSFDTARVYGNGLAERILGHWIRTRRLRDRVVIIGKGGHADAATASRVHPAFLTADLHASLRALRVERIDLYLLHRDDPSIPVGVIMSGLHRLVQAGKVRALGASNWSHTRIEDANRYAYAHGLTPFSVSSPHFSLAEMRESPWPGVLSITGEAAAGARAWYAATRMPVLAWSPLAGGFLAGSAALDEAQRRAYGSSVNDARRERLATLARERGVIAAGLALAYALAQPMDVHPIVAARSPEKLRALLEASRIELSPEERTWLESGTREQTEPRTPAQECRSPS